MIFHEIAFLKYYHAALALIASFKSRCRFDINILAWACCMFVSVQLSDQNDIARKSLVPHGLLPHL